MSWSRRRYRPCKEGLNVLQLVFTLYIAAFAPLALAAGRLHGLDLAEAISASTIDSMKADMSINFLEAALLQATLSASGDLDDSLTGGDCTSPGGGGCSWPAYSLMDADGVLHTCTVREELPEKRDARGRRSVGREVATSLDGLNGRCETLKHDYWSYEWCHRKGITQFHELEDGTLKTISLGTFRRTEVKRINSPSTQADADTITKKMAPVLTEQPGDGDSNAEPKIARGSIDHDERVADDDDDDGDDDDDDGDDDDDDDDDDDVAYADEDDDSEAYGHWLSRVLKGMGKEDDPYRGIQDLSQVAEVHDVFEGGDKCEETGGPRQTRVVFMCCATKSLGTSGFGTPPAAVLVSIHEVDLCTYLVRVCSKLLCPEPAGGERVGAGSRGAIDSEDSSAPPVATAGGVIGILEALEACFPTKQIGYWLYRLCFSSGIIQYHVELVKNSADLETTITAEYSLGEFDHSRIKGMGEYLIGQGEDGEAAIIVEFEGGTECDLTGVLRSSTVYLKCGMVHEVKDVIEDRTCHYKIEARSPLLCSHSRLVQKEETVRTVKCIAEDRSKSKTGTDREKPPHGKRDGGQMSSEENVWEEGASKRTKNEGTASGKILGEDPM